MTTKKVIGSVRGNRLFTVQPTYYIDPKDGLSKVEQWKGAYSMSDETKNVVPPVSVGTPVLPQVVVVVLTVLAVLAAGVTSVAAVVPGIPPAVTVIAGAVTAICTVFGVVSPGVRRPAEAVKQDTLK